MKRRIIKAEVTMVSLCKRGVNGLVTLFKGEGARLQALVKAAPNFDEMGELLAVVAAPNLLDSEGDVFASPDAIRKAAHSFMRHGSKLDLQHNMKPLGKDAAVVAESFIIQKGDLRFADWKDYAGNSVDVSGGWGMLINIGDENLRKSYRSGEWDGVSLFAPAAELQILEKADADVSTALRSLFKDAGLITDHDATETDDMKPEDIQALTAGISKAVAESVAAALKPAPAKADADAPVFAGDPNSIDDLSKHQAALERHALLKSGVLADPVKVAALVKAAQDAADSKKVEPKKAREALRKSNPTLAKALDDKDAAEARIAELQKASNVPDADDTDESASKGDLAADDLVRRGLLKAEHAGLPAAGRAAAAAENKRRQGAYHMPDRKAG